MSIPRRHLALALTALLLASAASLAGLPGRAPRAALADTEAFQFPMANWYGRSVGFGFGSPWAINSPPYCGGYLYQHTGVDRMGSISDWALAAGDGTIAAWTQQVPWGFAAVLRHWVPRDGAYRTTTYWHIANGLPTGTFYTMGSPMAQLYNQGSNTHLHFSVFLADYDSTYTFKGALPDYRSNGCGLYTFQYLFTDPEAYVNPRQVVVTSGTGYVSRPGPAYSLTGNWTYLNAGTYYLETRITGSGGNYATMLFGGGSGSINLAADNYYVGVYLGSSYGDQSYFYGYICGSLQNCANNVWPGGGYITLNPDTYSVWTHIS